MKRLLIIGASVLQVPAIRRAKEMGLYVAVADFNPKAVGIPLADVYYDVSTIDEEGIYQAAKDFRADGVMTLATDMPMRAVAYACERLGLCGVSYATAVKATDKAEMIRAFEVAGVAHPWYHIISSPEQLGDVLDRITYPCVSKPTDNSGSRGVMLVENKEALMASVAYSARHGRKGAVIIEEYMRGPEVSVEVLVVDGVAHVLQVTDKLTTGAPHFVEMGHTQPSMLPAKDVEKIRDLACRASLAVGIQNGPAHVEIMLTQNGPKMVEIGARMGGDCITTHLVPLSTGIDMVEATIRIALGEKPDVTPKFERGAAIRYLKAEVGTIRAINGTEAARSVPGVREVTFTKAVGETADSIRSSVDRIGHIVAQADRPEEAVAVCEAALAKITVQVC